MHFKTVLVTSALAATALAAPNAQWGPPRYGRPTTTSTRKTTVSSADDCAAPTATTTAYVTVTEHDEATTKSSTTSSASSSTSTTVIVDPTGGSSTSSSIVIVDPTGGSSSSSVVSECTATTAVETLTETAVSTATVTDVSTVTVGVPGSDSTITVTDSATVTEIATVTVPYPGGNTTVPGPTGTATPGKDCITEEEADDLAEVFRLLIQEYSDDLALAALTEDFVDYSSAVNIIMNKGAQYPKNITGPTFATRAEFMAGQGKQPLIPFERLTTFHGCDSVTARWYTSRSASGQKTEVAAIPVVGNGILHVVRSTEPVKTHKGVTYNWRVKELYSEFNAAAWLVNLGVFKPAGKVDYFNTTNTTTTKRDLDLFEHYDESLRGAIL